MKGFDEIAEYLEEDKEVSRRKVLGATGAAGLASLSGCSVPNPEYTNWGRFRIKVPGGVPLIDEDAIPLVTYSAPRLEDTARAIHDTAEEEIDAPTVKEVNNKILMDTFYFKDTEILEAMKNNKRLVGDPDEISQLIGNKHYATMKMGIKAAGVTRDIKQYLSKDLRSEYIDNISEPFQNAFKIAYNVGNPVFDIGGADERDDQFIGMELYMLGNGNSRAGRYFNTSEIKRYGQGSLSTLENDLEKEAEEPGGFEFFL